MKVYGGVEVLLRSFLNLALERSAPRSGRFTPGERSPVTHFLGCWAGPRARLATLEKNESVVPAGNMICQSSSSEPRHCSDYTHTYTRATLKSCASYSYSMFTVADRYR